ncbi:M14 family metallocarboxypeptidase [Aliiglaciecola sp. LCG003]|uniref:M14 family metallopeptidase n=1 Tax=Aliiglaciecola sp. LCG003 TaxID=3053655 RepID=UPI00257361D0|nr:M14 family metallocarboxypeptidase [Aliiglaciecola sp. LCG003]WJG09153.1 M14 family metallocarboxypeptidase [Aliiglaciecola sp. LCG003]
MTQYPIGTLGEAWDEQNKLEWLAAQQVKREYQQEVLDKLTNLPSELKMVQYGALPYDESRYPVFALISANWDTNKPNIMITGGVHGYETSGVQGAIRFALTQVQHYSSAFNFVILPCISPWGYETINRWGPYALDPNRSFYPDSPAPESALAMAYVKSLDIELLAHFDLHETTDSDNSEFRPALAARDGVTNHNWNIPDGFYGVGDTSNPVPEFQKAIIDSVAKVTHIAPADPDGKLIGVELAQHGVINYDKRKLHLCGGFAGGDFVTTTEVYPDSPNSDAENCINAQVAAIVGGLDYLLERQK